MGWVTMNDRTAQKRSYWHRHVPPPPAGPPGMHKPPRRHSVAWLIAAMAAAVLVAAGGATVPAAALTHTADPAAATQTTLVVSQAGVPRSGNGEPWQQAWACGLSAGLERLKSYGPDGKNLYDAIEVTLEGRDLAANIADLVKAAVMFGLDVLPYGACFEPYFFPPPTGGGATPAAPTGLTVSPDPNDGTVLKLSWNEDSDNVLYFDVTNGVDERSTPADTDTYTWHGLKPGSWTCFRVRATNGDTSSDWDPNVAPWYVCAYSSSPSPRPAASQCVFLLPNQVNCTSSVPKITLEGENVGDTSGCTFSGRITWGDGSQQTVQYRGANNQPSSVANHTYQRKGTYSITLVPTVISGPCSASSGSYKFTYS
jgi:Fibronectin type III domain